MQISKLLGITAGYGRGSSLLLWSISQVLYPRTKTKDEFHSPPVISNTSFKHLHPSAHSPFDAWSFAELTQQFRTYPLVSIVQTLSWADKTSTCLKLPEDSAHSVSIPWLSLSKMHDITTTRIRVCKPFGYLTSQCFPFTKANCPLDRNQASRQVGTFSVFILNHHCDPSSHCFSKTHFTNQFPPLSLCISLTSWYYQNPLIFNHYHKL